MLEPRVCRLDRRLPPLLPAPGVGVRAAGGLTSSDVAILYRPRRDIHPRFAPQDREAPGAAHHFRVKVLPGTLRPHRDDAGTAT